MWFRRAIAVGVAAVVVVGAGPPPVRAQAVAERGLPNEWLVAQTGPEVLAAATDVLRSMGATFARQDIAGGLVITREMSYGRDWPDAASLGLPPTHVPRSVTVHLHVAPGFFPARLAIGAILVTDTTFVPLRSDRARGDATMYGHPELGAAIAHRIAARLGTTLVAMPADAEVRAREAARLGGGSCGPARLYTGEGKGPSPRLVSDLKPEYPRPQIAKRIGGAVQFSGEVTEHGTLVGLDWQKGIEDPNLVAAARGAASLWRFVAPVVDGCSARRTIMLEMSFQLSR